MLPLNNTLPRREFFLRTGLLALGLASRMVPRGYAAEDVTAEFDLAVIGGGSAGFGAAFAAARMGLRVVLIEKADCLGGNSVRGGVSVWEPGVGGTGIPYDLYLRLRKIPSAVGVYSFGRHLSWFKPDKEPYRFPGGETVIDPARSYLDTLRRHSTPGMGRDEKFCREHWHGIVFEPEVMASTMKSMLVETGHCQVLLGESFTGAQARDGRLDWINLASGKRIKALNYVDATGDGWVCASLGCRMMSGQDARADFGEPGAPERATGRCNGVTLIYRVTKASAPTVEALPAGIAENCWWQAKYPVAQMCHYPNGDLNINMLPTMEGEEFMKLGYQQARTECERRARAHWHNLQARFEEFRQFRMVQMAPALGVRESKRVQGEYVLTENDVRGGISRQQHADIICLADHSLDTHGSHVRGVTGELFEPYGVPFRCLIPQGFRNLLIACRAASFTSLAASSCRLSRTMMQLGQAAGTAAVLVKTSANDFPRLAVARLRELLLDQRVQLSHPMPQTLRKQLV
jgi:hypothetical protein